MGLSKNRRVQKGLGMWEWMSISWHLAVCTSFQLHYKKLKLGLSYIDTSVRISRWSTIIFLIFEVLIILLTQSSSFLLMNWWKHRLSGYILRRIIILVVVRSWEWGSEEVFNGYCFTFTRWKSSWGWMVVIIAQCYELSYYHWTVCLKVVKIWGGINWKIGIDTYTPLSIK